MKKSILVLAAVALLLGGWAMLAPTARALPAFGPGGWMRQMQTSEMWEAMQSGNMWEYMNRPEVREQMQNTPMGQYMYSEDMQKFMTSDAFREFSQSGTAKQMIERGVGSCHGSVQTTDSGQTK